MKLCALNSLTAILESDRDFTISAELTSSIFESLQGSIHSIKVKDNVVWVGTVGGSVSRYKDGQWQTVVGFD